MNIDNIYEVMNAIDDNASLNKTITKKPMSENRSSKKLSRKTMNEKYDEEAPYGRNTPYGGYYAKKDPLSDNSAPQWWIRQGGTQSSWENHIAGADARSRAARAQRAHELGEGYDEEAPLGRHELYPGARSKDLGDPIPQWVKDKYGSGAKAAWDKMRNDSKGMNNHRNPWESFKDQTNNKLILEDEETPVETSSDAGPEKITSELQNSDYPEFVKILNSDGKSAAFLKYLKAHYKLGDNALGAVVKAAPVKKVMKCKMLQPTQSNISLSKSLGMIKEGGWSVNIINDPLTAFDTPTIVYAGKYIIDGHHRWSKVVALHGVDSELTVINFPEVPGLNWEDMLKATQLAIVSTSSNAKLINPVGNDNMLSAAGPKAAAMYYMQEACDEVVAAMKAKGYGDTKEAQAKKVGMNVKQMAVKTPPVDNAQDRSIMPQADVKALKKMSNSLIDVTPEPTK